MSNMLDSYPAGPVACVSDSYDVFKVGTVAYTPPSSSSRSELSE